MKPLSKTAALRHHFPAVLSEFARLCIDFDISLEEVTESFKASMIQAAKLQTETLGDIATKSRIALMTGMSRKEVARLWEVKPRETEARPSALATVVIEWRIGRRWRGPDGKPLDLPVKGPRSITALCKACQLTGYTVRSFIDQLERIGTIEALVDGRYRIVGTETIPNNWEDLVIGCMRNLSMHIGTIRHNLNHPDDRWLEKVVGGTRILRSRFHHIKRLLDTDARRQAERWYEEAEKNEGEAGCDSAIIGLFYWQRLFGE